LARSALSEASALLMHYVRGSVFDADYLQSVFRGNPNIVHTIGAFLDDRSKSVGTVYEHINCNPSIVVACAMADKFDSNYNLSEDQKALLYFSVAKGFPEFIFDQTLVKSKRKAKAALLGVEFGNKLRVDIFRTSICIQFYSLYFKGYLHCFIGAIYSFHKRLRIILLVFGLYVTGFMMRL
jgi:hypothetical protein